MQRLPKWLTGDLVVRDSIRSRDANRRGIIVSVRNANPIVWSDNEHNSFLGQYVYYVFFQDGKLEGPLFQSELSDIM